MFNKNGFQEDAYRPLLTIWGVSVRGSPWTETPPLDRDPPKTPLDRDPPPQTEILLDRDHPGQRPPDRDPSQTETTLDRDPDPPPVDRQTPVKILPCPKLRLREVINAAICIKQNPSTANRVASTWRCSVKSTCRISPSISAQWGTLCRSLR